MDGVRAISKLTNAGSPARVLVLTTYDTDSDVLAEHRPAVGLRAQGGDQAIEAGATEYLLNDAPWTELFRAARAAARAAAVLSPSVATRIVGQVRAPVLDGIGRRELEVLELVARGATNRDAAAKLLSARRPSRRT